MIPSINTQKQRIFTISIAASLCIHIAGLFWVTQPWSVPAIKSHRLRDQMVLQFMHTPEQREEKIPLNRTNLISELSTQSQNLETHDKIDNEDPYQEGEHENKSLLQTESFAAQTTNISKKAETQHQEQTEVDETPVLDNQPEKISVSEGNPPSLINQPSIRTDEIPSPRSKNILTSSEIIDEYRYNAQSSDVARYLSKELKNISNVWRLSILTEAILPTRLNRTVIAFKIMDDGQYTQMQILAHKGDIFTQNYALNAIKKVAPFSALPDNVKSYIRDDGLWVIIDFNYKD